MSNFYVLRRKCRNLEWLYLVIFWTSFKLPSTSTTDYAALVSLNSRIREQIWRMREQKRKISVHLRECILTCFFEGDHSIDALCMMQCNHWIDQKLFNFWSKITNFGLIQPMKLSALVLSDSLKTKRTCLY